MGLLDYIKKLFYRSRHKQLPEETVIARKTKELDKFKTTPLSEMGTDEINKILEEKQKCPKKKPLYHQEQILEAIFLKIGASKDLAKKASENIQVQKIFSFHKNGRLVENEDGTIYFEDQRSEEDITKIQYQDEKIILQSSQDKDYYGEDALGREGDKDGRPTHKVQIFTNELEGVTLENEETGHFFKMENHQIHDHYYSTIVYDNHNVEWKKKKEHNNGATTIVERIKEDPFTVKEIYQSSAEEGKKAEEYISYASINPAFPDKLYSREFVPWPQVGRVDKINKVPILKERLEVLRYRNPKAAEYFASLKKVPKDKKEKQR